MAAIAKAPLAKGFRFLSLPLEIRMEIYKFVFYSSETHACSIYTTEYRSGDGYYKISPRGPPGIYWHSPTLLLCVNRQIYHEALEVCYSTPVRLDFRECPFGELDTDPAGCPQRYFMPGRFKRLHSVFKNVRKLEIDFDEMPFDFPTTKEWRSVYSEQGDWMNEMLRSLLPRRPFEDLTALKSVTVDMMINGWEINEHDTSYLWDMVGGLVTVLPAKVDVQLHWWFYRSKEKGNDDEERERFGEWLTDEFARKRTAHVASILKKPGSSKREEEHQEGKGHIRRVEDDGLEVLSEDGQGESEEDWEGTESEEDETDGREDFWDSGKIQSPETGHKTDQMADLPESYEESGGVEDD